jgi:hypothetical protein
MAFWLDKEKYSWPKLPAIRHAQEKLTWIIGILIALSVFGFPQQQGLPFWIETTF